MTRQPPARALITGASSGLGAALARRLAARGIEVFLLARRVERLAELASAIRSAGGRAHVLALDLSQSELVFERLSALDREVGIDLVVANGALAGPAAGIALTRASFANSSQILNTNLLGATATLSAFIPGMLERGHGHLVAVSSISARAPNPRMPVYGAAKAGLSFLLQSIDMELRPRGVAVTLIEPGFMRTEAVEGVHDWMPWMVESDRAAAIIERAIERRARLVRFPWPLVWLLRLGALLPAALVAPLTRMLVAERQAPRLPSSAGRN